MELWDEVEDLEDEMGEEEAEVTAYLDRREAIVARGWTARPQGFAYVAED